MQKLKLLNTKHRFLKTEIRFKKFNVQTLKLKSLLNETLGTNKKASQNIKNLKIQVILAKTHLHIQKANVKTKKIS